MPKRNPQKEKKIAKERIEKLFLEADEASDFAYGDRYVEMARKLSMKYKVRIPSKLQKKFCKTCYKYLRPGVNCRVRTRLGKVVYFCYACKNYMRFPFVKEQKQKRNK
ncbi:ribonuclease P protein component 4 [Nanoarchaeota archaeon]